MKLEANTPVSSAPTVPPTPCTPNASSESSYPRRALIDDVIRKHTTPATRPIASADIGLTNPDAGVIATSPATDPEIAPSALGFPRRIHSAVVHPTTAAAAPKWVATNALVARLPDDSALPAL